MDNSANFASNLLTPSVLTFLLCFSAQTALYKDALAQEPTSNVYFHCYAGGVQRGGDRDFNLRFGVDEGRGVVLTRQRFNFSDRSADDEVMILENRGRVDWKTLSYQLPGVSATIELRRRARVYFPAKADGNEAWNVFCLEISAKEAEAPFNRVRTVFAQNADSCEKIKYLSPGTLARLVYESAPTNSAAPIRRVSRILSSTSYNAYGNRMSAEGKQCIVFIKPSSVGQPFECHFRSAYEQHGRVYADQVDLRTCTTGTVELKSEIIEAFGE